MKKAHPSLSRQSRVAARGVSLCGTVAILLAGLLGGKSRAQAFAAASFPRSELRAVPQQSARTNAGFDFYDLRVQTAEDSAPALRQVRSGQEVRVGVYIRYRKTSRMKRGSSAASRRSGAPHPENALAATRARFVCRYTLLYKGLELRRDTLPVESPLAEGSAVTTFRAFTITLPEGVQQNSYVVRASVTMNGATQTRTTRFTVYR